MVSGEPNQKINSLSIVLCGQAGQGIQTVEFLLTRILKFAGYNVFATKEFMSRIRGGTNSTEIRVSSMPVQAFVDRIDILVPLDKHALVHLEKRISSDTLILGEKINLGTATQQKSDNFIEVAFSQIASEIGNKIYSNIVAVGTFLGLFGIEPQAAAAYIKKHFISKSKSVIEENIKAVEAGYRIGNELLISERIKINIEKGPNLAAQMLLNGAEAIALGALAGGCNFISSYPMSPSTGVLVFLASKQKDFQIVAEQAEDEIAAINMAIGAWYAGARGMVTTSGGGFALMAEGLSLAGMLESPIVIHLAQRPGPATGLPTRTEQADLELALYAGHGEFPRIILAPGTAEEGFYLTQKAFNLADKYQIPVIILTDQYFIDSYYNIPDLDLTDLDIKKHIVKTKADYRRYELTDSGISPRGIPGHGKGLVCVDSDEHDQMGHITEDLELRVKMVDKRLRKYESIKHDIIRPEIIGPEDYKILILCWGSTRNVVTEAVTAISRNDTAILHFKQLHPLHEKTIDYLKKAEKRIIIEGNATSQFGKLIKLKTGFDLEKRILKYNGLSFTVEELTGELRNILDQG